MATVSKCGILGDVELASKTSYKTSNKRHEQFLLSEIERNERERERELLTLSCNILVSV